MTCVMLSIVLNIFNLIIYGTSAALMLAIWQILFVNLGVLIEKLIVIVHRELIKGWEISS